MTQRTITFDSDQWQVVPRKATQAIVEAIDDAFLAARDVYEAALAAAPEPPTQDPEPAFYLNVRAVDAATGKIKSPLGTALTWRSKPVAGWSMPVYLSPPGRSPLAARDSAVWRAALTLANKTCVEESDRFLADDRKVEAEAAVCCAERIRQWIETPEEQLTQMLESAGIGNGAIE